MTRGWVLGEGRQETLPVLGEGRQEILILPLENLVWIQLRILIQSWRDPEFIENTPRLPSVEAAIGAWKQPDARDSYTHPA